MDRVKKAVQVSNRFSIFWGLFAWALLAIFANPIASIFNDNEEVIRTVELFLWIVPAGFGLQGILSIINSHLNTINKPLQASLIIVVQMLVLGLPAIYLGKQLADITGIFIALALTYAAGGILSIIVNRQLMGQLSRNE